MDAIEFVKQLRRMDKYGGRKYSIFNDSPEDVVAEVEKWSKEHPLPECLACSDFVDKAQDDLETFYGRAGQ